MIRPSAERSEVSAQAAVVPAAEQVVREARRVSTTATPAGSTIPAA